MREQRLEVAYEKTQAAAHLGQVEVARAWEDAVRAAGLAPEGQRRPRLAIAAPLPPGYTSEAELVEAYLTDAVNPTEAAERLQSRLPVGLRVTGVRRVLPAEPPLPVRVQWSEYLAWFEPGLSARDARAAAARALEARALPLLEVKGGKTRETDIRPLIADMWLEDETEGGVILGMRLRCGQAGNCRPDQASAALGIGAPTRVHRTRLLLGGLSAVHHRWRHTGRFQER